MDEKRIAKLLEVLQTQYIVWITDDGRIQLKDFDSDHVFHEFDDWEACQAWTVKMEWDATEIETADEEDYS